jgi:HEAT repeat protein
LGLLRDQTGLPALVSALDSRSERLQASAARSLGELGSSEATVPLIALIRRSADWGVRAQAVEALGRIGSPVAIDPLIAALKDTKQMVRLAAVEALGRYKDPRAISALVSSLEDPRWIVRSRAADVVADTGGEEELDALKRVQAGAGLVTKRAMRSTIRRMQGRLTDAS